MGYVDPENLKVKKLPFSYAVFDRNMIEAINKYQPHAAIHIFVDTGMGREGMRIDELQSFLNYLKTFNKIKVDGLMSHLAASEDIGNALTRKQLINFEKAKVLCKKTVSNLSGFILGIHQLY